MPAASRHGFRSTMIATRKRNAIQEMAATFSGKSDAAQANRDVKATDLNAKVCTRA